MVNLSGTLSEGEVHRQGLTYATRCATLANMKYPTYKEIAAACAVHVSTVSRALNNHSSIPLGTTERIRAIAEGLGWHPNPLASAYMAHLRSTHSPSFKATLGVILDRPFPLPHKVDCTNLEKMIVGFKRRATEYGYGTDLFSLVDPGLSGSRLDRALSSRNITGIVIGNLSEAGKAPFVIDWSRYASVALGYPLTDPMVHRVATDTTHGFQLVISKALELGYRHIGVSISKQYDARTNHALLRAARYWQGERDRKTTKIDTLLFEEEEPERSIEEVAAWLDRCRPDFAVGNWVYEAIQSLGWRIPEDIAFASLDRSSDFPSHAGLDQDYAISGALAADIVIAEVAHNRRGIPPVPVEHLFRGHWVDGPTAPPRGSR